MAKVKDVLGERPPFAIRDFSGEPIDPSQIWARYDGEADSVVIYLTSVPQLSVSVYVDNDLYLMVSPRDRKLIGFQIENWERSFVPAHADIQAVWAPVKLVQSNPQPWETLMRMIGLWTIFVLRAEIGPAAVMQPA